MHNSTCMLVKIRWHCLQLLTVAQGEANRLLNPLIAGAVISCQNQV